MENLDKENDNQFSINKRKKINRCASDNYIQEYSNKYPLSPNQNELKSMKNILQISKNNLSAKSKNSNCDFNHNYNLKNISSRQTSNENSIHRNSLLPSSILNSNDRQNTNYNNLHENKNLNLNKEEILHNKINKIILDSTNINLLGKVCNYQNKILKNNSLKEYKGSCSNIKETNKNLNNTQKINSNNNLLKRQGTKKSKKFISKSNINDKSKNDSNKENENIYIKINVNKNTNLYSKHQHTHQDEKPINTYLKGNIKLSNIDKGRNGFSFNNLLNSVNKLQLFTKNESYCFSNITSNGNTYTHTNTQTRENIANTRQNKIEDMKLLNINNSNIKIIEFPNNKKEQKNILITDKVTKNLSEEKISSSNPSKAKIKCQKRKFVNNRNNPLNKSEKKIINQISYMNKLLSKKHTERNSKSKLSLSSLKSSKSFNKKKKLITNDSCILQDNSLGGSKSIINSKSKNVILNSKNKKLHIFIDDERDNNNFYASKNNLHNNTRSLTNQNDLKLIDKENNMNKYLSYSNLNEFSEINFSNEIYNSLKNRDLAEEPEDIHIMFVNVYQKRKKLCSNLANKFTVVDEEELLNCL